jgi:acyl-ACP thioesterase
MVLHTDTLKPVKPTQELFGSLPFCEDDALAPVFPRITLPENPQEATQAAFAPTMTDIDVNNHVNNLNYVRWILSYSPQWVWEGRRIQTLDTYFIASAKLGDSLVCKTVVASGTENAGEPGRDALECIHSITRTRDNTELFRARTVWKNAQTLSRKLQVD